MSLERPDGPWIGNVGEMGGRRKDKQRGERKLLKEENLLDEPKADFTPRPEVAR